VVRPDKRRLKRRKVDQFRRRLRGALAASAAGELPAAHLAASVQGWIAHARYGNTTGLQKAVLEAVPAEVRAMVTEPT